MRPLTIALLNYSTKPRGSVVHTLWLAEALAEAGQRVTVWTLGRGGDCTFFRRVDPRVQVRIAPFPDIAGKEVGPCVLRSIQVLADAFDPTGYDVVHAQDCISANAAGRCIRTVHHIDHFCTPELAACHERAITDPFAHVCVSAAVAAELLDGWGITAEVIPNGVDAQRFSDAAGPARATAWQEWRSRLGRYVLAVGGIEPRKGSLELLDAYALVCKHIPDVRLVIAGGETLFDYRDYRARWEQRAAGVPLVMSPASAPRDILRRRPIRRQPSRTGSRADGRAHRPRPRHSEGRPSASRPLHLVGRRTAPPRALLPPLIRCVVSPARCVRLSGPDRAVLTRTLPIFA